MTKKKNTRRGSRILLSVKSDPVRDAEAAFGGAVYHFGEVKRIFKLGLLEQSEVNQFHYHLRAFFWELSAVVDCLASDKKHSARKVAEAIKATSWFQEISDYRNHAHRSFVVVEVMRPNKPGARAIAFMLTALGAGHGGPGMGLMKRYLDEMWAQLKPLLTVPKAVPASTEIDPS